MTLRLADAGSGLDSAPYLTASQATLRRVDTIVLLAHYMFELDNDEANRQCTASKDITVLHSFAE